MARREKFSRNFEVLLILVLLIVGALIYWNPIGYFQDRDEWNLKYAYDNYEAKQYVKAEKFLDNVEILGKHGIESQFLRGMIFFNKGDLDNVSDYANQLCNMNTDAAYSYCYHLKGKVALQDCDYVSALNYFNLSWQYNHSNIEQYLFLALGFYHMKDYEKTLMMIKLAEREYNDDDYNLARLYILRGSVYMDRKLYENALVQFEKANSINIKSQSFLNNYIAIDCTGI